MLPTTTPATHGPDPHISIASADCVKVECARVNAAKRVGVGQFRVYAVVYQHAVGARSLLPTADV